MQLIVDRQLISIFLFEFEPTKSPGLDSIHLSLPNSWLSSTFLVWRLAPFLRNNAPAKVSNNCQSASRTFGGIYTGLTIKVEVQ